MVTWSGLRRQRAGFTLLELLLTTLLLLLLFGAVVFNFDSLQRGAQLEDAALQMEGLLRFASAQAAQTGRRVQLSFEPTLGDDFFDVLGGMQLRWEPDPLEQPGLYQPLREAEDYVQRITDAVLIEEVRRLDANGRELDSASAGIAEESALATEADPAQTPSIDFYPDGTSDSAVIVLTSWDYDDPRRIELKLIGLTGAIRRTLRSSETDSLGSEPVDAPRQTNRATQASSTRPAPVALTNAAD